MFCLYSLIICFMVFTAHFFINQKFLQLLGIGRITISNHGRKEAAQSIHFVMPVHDGYWEDKVKN